MFVSLFVFRFLLESIQYKMGIVHHSTDFSRNFSYRFSFRRCSNFISSSRYRRCTSCWCTGRLYVISTWRTCSWWSQSSVIFEEVNQDTTYTFKLRLRCPNLSSGLFLLQIKQFSNMSVNWIMLHITSKFRYLHLIFTHHIRLVSVC